MGAIERAEERERERGSEGESSRFVRSFPVSSPPAFFPLAPAMVDLLETN